MQVQVKNYSFSALNKQITFTDYVTIDIDSVLYIIHVTDHRAIYNPLNKNLKGSVSGNTLTLNYDTSLMSDDDELMIYYDKIPDPATEAKQDTQITALGLVATEETLKDIQGFQIPAYDTQVIDESLAPTTTTITYKLSGVTVATKTIGVSETTTTISVTKP